MSEVVVDTNVWVKVDEEVLDLTAVGEKDCILACQRWLEEFIDSDDRWSLMTMRLISSFRSTAEMFVPAASPRICLTSSRGVYFHRLVQKTVQLDRDGNAILPAPFSLTHEKDRVFVAVAIQCEPYASIFFATDTDWAQDMASLEQRGLTIIALCPDYIRERLSER